MDALFHLCGRIEAAVEAAAEKEAGMGDGERRLSEPYRLAAKVEPLLEQIRQLKAEAKSMTLDALDGKGTAIISNKSVTLDRRRCVEDLETKVDELSWRNTEMVTATKDGAAAAPAVENDGATAAPAVEDGAAAAPAVMKDGAAAAP